jgi:nucleoside-diphosphate-sugar epimerase
MTTLVTGGFGCIGAWVIRGLLAAGERPVVFDLGDDPWRVRMIAGPDAPERLCLVRGDITDKAQLERVVRDHGVRRVIHLAAWQVPLCRQDPPRGASINVTGTANVFEVARASAGQVERVVYASSAAVFGAPSSIRAGRSRTTRHRGRRRTTAFTRWPTRRRLGSAPRASARSRSMGPAVISGSRPIRHLR